MSCQTCNRRAEFVCCNLYFCKADLDQHLYQVSKHTNTQRIESNISDSMKIELRGTLRKRIATL